MKNTLHLNLERRFFWDIAQGTKHVEYRDRTRYWKNRLESRNYELIQLRNGYASKAPEMIVEFRGLRRRGREYQILLGRVLEIKRWKPPKPSKREIRRARSYINSMEWKFAKSMPQWPHWYVFREDGSAREFDFVEWLVNTFGCPDPWRTRIKYSLRIGRFKYWVDGDCLNRGAPISNEEVIKRGDRWLARHRMKVGPYGRAIPLKNKRVRK